jgi:predicted transcriptional regulator
LSEAFNISNEVACKKVIAVQKAIAELCHVLMQGAKEARAANVSRYAEEPDILTLLIAHTVISATLEQRPITISAISNILCIPRSTASRRVNQMKNWGVIRSHEGGGIYYTHNEKTVTHLQSYLGRVEILFRKTYQTLQTLSSIQ